MAPGRKAKRLPRPCTAGTNVKHIIHPCGGRGTLFQKTIRPSQEPALLRTGPKIIMRSNMPLHFPPTPSGFSSQWITELEEFGSFEAGETNPNNPSHTSQNILDLFPSRY